MTDFNQEIAVDELYVATDEFKAKSHIGSREQYDEIYRQSEEPEKFWANEASLLTWSTPFTKAMGEYNFDHRKGPIKSEWFVGGELNACYNCVDKWVAAGKGDDVAFLYETNDVDDPAARAFTFSEVLDMVQRLANTLKGFGVGKGDVVAIYLPMIVELPVAMLACARIGAVHSVVFGGFGADALAGRIADGKSRVIVTADGVAARSRSR